MSDDGVVKLVTKAERSAHDEEEYLAGLHAESVAMLERALAMAKEGPRKLRGVVVAMVFDDGCYGRMIPEELYDSSRLMGAAQCIVNDIWLRTFDKR